MPPSSGPSVIALGACDAAAFWPRFAQAVAGFAERHGVDHRDLLVLLPFAQHLALAEAAWAALPEAAWMPRFETTQTLARRHGPPVPPVPGTPCFDPLADALEAARQLRGHLPPALVKDGPRFDAIVQRVVETTHALAWARLALPPSRRAAWLATARSSLAPAATAGAMERSLASFALAWSATVERGPADALWAGSAAARIALRVGSVDAAVQAWMELEGAPRLWIEADLPLDDATCWPVAAARSFDLCRDFEEEAQRAAACVLGHVARGETPVALVALDRVLLRRVRALLDRRQVSIDDESGWMLSTTRAGAAVAGLLRGVQAGASADELLDAWAALPETQAELGALDRLLRRRQITAARRVDEGMLDGPLRSAWSRWRELAEPLQRGRSLPLAQWLGALEESLRRAGLWPQLAADAAGAQVLQALRLADGATGWPPHLTQDLFDAGAFTAWVRQVLESIAYRPVGEHGTGTAQVVITPLARAALRPFAAVVCPGADAAHLGARPTPSLLADAVATALGVPTATQQVEAERRAFAQLLRAPVLALSVRRADGSEPLVPAAAVLAMVWAAERAGQAFGPTADARVARRVEPAPQPRPLPVAPALLPAEVHATAYEALRTCPYRYFALRMLALDEDEELDDALDPRDHGRWLHELLKDFHEARDPARPELDAAGLAEAAATALDRLGRDDDDFLPYALAFEAFAPRYLEWLHGQEREGWRVQRHELSLRLAALRLPGRGTPMPAWRGQLDRVDTRRGDGGDRLRILDYKASAADRLNARVRQPFEDTQLAFYAALLSASEGEPAGGLEAAYLAIDTGKPPELVEHPDVEASAAALLEGLAEDFEHLRDGAALPALGEGQACERCAARGLCRRDFWPEQGA